MSLLDAAYALDEIAAGRTPDRARLLALDTLKHQGKADRDLLDAGAGLEAIATGWVARSRRGGSEARACAGAGCAPGGRPLSLDNGSG